MKPAQVPLIHYDEAEAADAYLAYVAMITQEIMDPALKDNSAWAALRKIAFERFERAFVGTSNG